VNPVYAWTLLACITLTAAGLVWWLNRKRRHDREHPEDHRERDLY
jgi:hypothetical protein